ncbi:MAG: metal-dependent hydrolase [Deltaproteobacteria bacterium]|nr:metal-dependent hydrolase [Deltaproteobacteria bacterium]
MIFFGHLGLSLWGADRWQRGLDLRQLAAVAFCTLLPDLVDKPLAMLSLTPVPVGRLWAHTLVFSLLWCLVCWRWWRAMWPWALATPIHLLMDYMWVFPVTLWWPWLGLYFDPPLIYYGSYLELWAWNWRHEPLQFLLFTALPELAGLVLAWLVSSRVARTVPALTVGRLPGSLALSEPRQKPDQPR